MITARIILDGDNMLKGMSVSGHAGSAPAGKDVVCAAVTSLVRTAVRTLESHPGVTVRYNAPEEGSVELNVTGVEASERCWLRGMTDFVRMGLGDLQREAPEHLKVTEEKE